MCGIVGAIGYAMTEQSLDRPLLALRHRGPDGQGRYVDAALDVALGHTRLSIIDLEHGAQPLFSEERDLVLVCNGELYGFEELREGLQARGHRFSTGSDSEIILHLYQEHGLDFVRHLRGEFAFLLLDRARRELFAVRDRFGIKPLHFHRREGRFLFGSEAKALFATGKLAPRIRVEAVRDYLSFVVPDSIFEGVEVVPPGCMLRIDLARGTDEVIRYWDVDLHETEPGAGDFDEARALVRAQVEEAIRLRLRADVPLGVYLSGGIDSAIVAATVARLARGPVKAFTVAFTDDDEFNEVHLAQGMACRIGAEFHRVDCNRGTLLANAEDALWVSELPFQNLHGVGKHILAARAKEHVTVVLTGEGSDEVFLGYDFFTKGGRDGEPAAPPPAGGLARAMFDALGFVPRRDMRAQFSAPVQAVIRSLFRRDHHARLRARTPLETVAGRTGKDKIARLPERRRRQHYWIKNVLPQFILTKLGDRAEMSHGIEGRTPFLDHVLFESARAVSDEHKIRTGVEKAVLREAFRDDLTPEIQQRRKWPYMAPPLWIEEGAHPTLDRLLREYMSREALVRAGIFSPTAWTVIRLFAWLLSWSDSKPRRFLNQLALAMLTVQVLYAQYEGDFDESLRQRAAPPPGALLGVPLDVEGARGALHLAAQEGLPAGAAHHLAAGGLRDRPAPAHDDPPGRDRVLLEDRRAHRRRHRLRLAGCAADRPAFRPRAPAARPRPRPRPRRPRRRRRRPAAASGGRRAPSPRCPAGRRSGRG